jgi:hypothetical protein
MHGLNSSMIKGLNEKSMYTISTILTSLESLYIHIYIYEEINYRFEVSNYTLFKLQSKYLWIYVLILDSYNRQYDV